MKKLKIAAYLMVSTLALAGAVPVMAQESPTGTWGSSVTWRHAFDRSVDLSRAEAIKRARSGGYGPGDSNVTYNGDVISNNAYNGAVSNSNSTNAVNLTTNSSSVKNSGSGSVGITYQTGSTSYQASQNATSQNASSGNGGSSGNAASGPANGSND